MHFHSSGIKMIVSLGQALAGNSPPDCCVNLFKSLLTYKTKPIHTDGFCSMAEKEGFEHSEKVAKPVEALGQNIRHCHFHCHFAHLAKVYPFKFH